MFRVPALVALLLSSPAVADPVPAAPEPASYRCRLTFEAGLGLGWIHVAADGISETGDLGLSGPNLGIGGWVSGKLAITGRIAGVSHSHRGIRVTNTVIGAAAQYWIDDRYWLGGGLGLGLLVLTGSSFDSSQDNVTAGFGFDLRAGFAFSQTREHVFNLSLEVTPTLLSNGGERARYTGIALQFGYQHL
ncbi:hypothetical protein BH11MYX3_BH11MYX3_47300 [soil metagenome]